MINVPLEYLPVMLLTRDQLSSQIGEMLERSRDALTRREWALAERYATNAKEASQRVSGRPVDYALALLHLADTYRSTLRLGLALDYNQEAQLTLDKLSGPKYYHNRAVANYALGLTYHFLGSGTRASKWYVRARELFERAIRYWGWEDAAEPQQICGRAIHWIDTLIEALKKWVDVLQEEPLCASVWIPVFPIGPDGKVAAPRLFCMPATLRKAERSIQLGDKEYRLLHPRPWVPQQEGDRPPQKVVVVSNQPYVFTEPDPGAPDLMIDFRAPHFALRVDLGGAPFKVWHIQSEEGEAQAAQPEEEEPPEGTIPEPGDLVLVRWQCVGGSESLQGIDLTEADIQWGRFVRSPSGRIKWVQEIKIIGGGNLTGEVVALLRPVQ